MRYVHTFALTVALVALVACEDDVTGPAAECTDDTGIVTVSVSNAAQPVVSWDPACAVAMFLVEEDASDQWLISTDDSVWDDPAQANLIVPPVTYGVVPTGVTAPEPAASLQVGATYEVILWRVLSPESTATCMQHFEQMCLMAVHEFVR